MFATAPPDRAVKLFIDQFVTQAQRVKEPLEPQWRDNWNNYRVEAFTEGGMDAKRLNPYGSDYAGVYLGALKTPESHQVANTLLAVLLGSLFGVRDYVEAMPSGDEDIDKARLVSKLIMYGLERPGNFRTNYDVLKDAIIFGTGIYRAGWNHRTRTVPRRVPIDDGQGGFVLSPETGQPVTILQNVEVAVKDDYGQWPVNLWKCWLDPSHARLPDMDGLCEMFTISRDDLVAMRNNPAWLASGIDECMRGGSKGSYMPTIASATGDIPPKLLTESLVEDDIEPIKAFGYYGGWRYHGMIPSELTDSLNRSGMLDTPIAPNASVLLSIIGNHVVQATQNPQKDGELPYGTITLLPNTDIPYGLSPLSVIKYLQDASDTTFILSITALIESVYQNYLIGGGAAVAPGFKKALEARHPRESFMVAGDVLQVQPLPKDYQGLSIAMQGLGMLSQVMRNASNSKDPVQGITAGDRTTATEVQTVAGAALQGIEGIAIPIERDELPRQGKLCYDAYYINLDDDTKIFRRIGDDEAAKVSFMAIDGDYDVQFVGYRKALSKATKANDANRFFALMLQDPRIAASVNVLEFAKWYADECLEVKGMDRFIIQDQDEVLANLQVSRLRGPLEAAPGGGTAAALGAQEAGEPSGI